MREGQKDDFPGGICGERKNEKSGCIWLERAKNQRGWSSLQHEKKEMWKILQSMYGQEELSKIEIDDTPAMMVERMAEIIAQKAENGAISVFVIDEVPMMTSRKNFADRKEELRYMIGLLGNCEKKEHVVIVAVIPMSKYCTEMQKKKEVSTCYGEIEKPENCLVFV